MCTEEEEAFDANEHVEPFAEDCRLRAVASEGAVQEGASRESWRGILGGGC